MKDLRIAFFTIFEKSMVPTQRYRIEAYTNRDDFDLKHRYFSVIKKDEVNTLYGANLIRKVWLGLKIIFRRTCHLFLLRKYSAVFVSRECVPLPGYIFEFIIKNILKKRLVYDIDDAIWIKQVSDANKNISFLKSTKKFAKIIALADAIIAGNSYLAEYALHYNTNVTIIPSCVDLDTYTMQQKPKNSRICIGWSGSESTLPYLLDLLDVFREIQEKYPNKVYFKVISSRAKFEMEGVNIKAVRWNEEKEVEQLLELDIGVMPLFMDEWSKGKCSMKGIQYMGLGIATVMSNIGANKVVIQNGKNGFLADAAKDWVACLSNLIENENLRNEFGVEARNTIVEKYSIQSWLQKWKKILVEDDA